MWSDFVQFVWAVLNNWAAYSTGGLIVAAFSLWVGMRRKRVPRHVLLGLSAVFLLLAFFKAWEDQHLAYAKAQNELNATKPAFEIVAPDSAFSYVPKEDVTILFLVVGVTNHGAPSVAGHWNLEFSSPRLTTRVGYSQLPAEIAAPNIRGQFKDENSIYELAMSKPIDKGSAIVGWAYFEIKGRVAFEELDRGAAVMRLTCYDYTNSLQSSKTFGPISGSSIAPEYFPGLKGGFQGNAPKTQN